MDRELVLTFYAYLPLHAKFQNRRLGNCPTWDEFCFNPKWKDLLPGRNYVNIQIFTGPSGQIRFVK